MRVREWMTSRPEACDPDTDLAAAAMIMWRNDCGFVPVVEKHDGKLVGVITDRDICMALATRHVVAEDARVGDVMAREPHTCSSDDEVHTALQTMAAHQVRRLPAVDARGALEGVLSLNDLVRHAGAIAPRGRQDVLSGEILSALQRICEHRSHVLEQRAVAGLVEPLPAAIAEAVPLR